MQSRNIAYVPLLVHMQCFFVQRILSNTEYDKMSEDVYYSWRFKR